MHSKNAQIVEFWRNYGIILTIEDCRELIETTRGVFELLAVWDDQSTIIKKENKHESTRKKI